MLCTFNRGPLPEMTVCCVIGFPNAFPSDGVTTHVTTSPGRADRRGIASLYAALVTSRTLAPLIR